MRESVQKYLLDILDDRRRGAVARAIQCILWALSQLYHAGVWTRFRLYDMGVFRRHSLGCLTISVGNITVGGTGKTPVVEMLARALSEKGRKVAILSRGYKSRSSQADEYMEAMDGYSPRVVSDGGNVRLDPTQAGDEPYLLARNLRDVGTVVLVDKNRVKAGRYAISRMGVDTVILDDGFQYLALLRKPDCVCIDCTNPFGTGHLLPRGILREPLSRLARADCFFLTKTGGVELAAMKGKLRRINPKADIIETVHQPLYFEEVISGRREPPEFARGKDVHVLSAIARPESFETAIEKLGARIRRNIRFLDHHRFSADEMRRILAEASADGVHCVFTTQKDAVRLPALKSTPVPIFFLRVAIKITQGAAGFADCICGVCCV